MKKKTDNREFALKLILMEALQVFQGRRENKRLLEIIKLLECK
jgi:hypothetical protein